MRYFLIFIFSLIISHEVISQNLLESRQTSYFTYIYKITDPEAKSIYKNDFAEIDQSFFHTLVDSIPTDSSYHEVLPTGHYLKTFTEKNKLTFSITSVQNFEVKIINNNTDLSIQVYDSIGNIIDNAEVRSKSKRLRFDEKSQAYKDRKSNRKGLLSVTYQGFTAYYNLERSYNNSQFKRSSRKVLYSFPIKYVWIPIRYVIYLPIDGVKSISRGYPQGTISRTWNFFQKSYRKIACIFDDYHCGYYNNYKFTQKHTGYLVFNKPKYLPGDTVKFKAFIVTKKGKPISEELDVVVGDYKKYTKLTTLKPYRKGAYAYQFFLHDSLDLQLDKSYEVSLQKNDEKEYISDYFKYEDYELSKVKLELRTDGEEQYKDKEFTLYAKGTDENDLNLLDARVELLVKSDNPITFYGENIFIGDTLYFEQKALDPKEETSFIIPDSIFPKADFSYEAIVRLATSDNDIITEKKKITYYHQKIEINHSLQEDSLKVIFKNNDIDSEIDSKIYGVDNFKNETLLDISSLPATFKINPYYAEYLIVTDSIEEHISISSEASLINCLSERSSDSIHLVVDNPRNIPFNYYVYKKNKEQMRGYGSSFKLNDKTSSNQNYFVSIQYLWGGKITNENYRIPYNSKDLNIKVDRPAIVFPGQESEIQISVTDKEGNPVPDVDVTAFSYTKKFSESPPAIPSLEKSKKDKVIINNFKFENRTEKHPGIKLDYATWKILAGLDSIDYYQFIYPEKDIYKFIYTPEDSITQFAPFVIDDGNILKVHVVYVDSKPQYFSWSNNPQPYSFRIDSGYHQIKLRTMYKMITLDSLYFPVGKKMIFSLLDTLKRKHVAITDAEYKLSSEEKRSLYKYIFPYRNTFGNHYAFIKQGDNIQLLTGPRANNLHLFAGPVSGKGLSFRLVNGYSTRFKHEPLYEYEISKGLLKMRTIDPEDQYPQQFSFSNPRVELQDLVMTEKKINQLWKQKVEQERYSTAKYVNPHRTSTGNGTLLIDYKKSKKSSLHPLNIIVFKNDDHEFLRVYPGTTNTFYDLKKGSYKLIYFYPGSKYHVYDSIGVKPNGLNYQLITEPSTLSKDTFSITVNKIIEKTIFKPKSIDDLNTNQELGGIYNAYQNQFRFTGSGDLIQGYVYEIDTDDPLPGVNVIIKGTTFGTVTDIDGFYSLKVPYYANSLVISYIGFVSEEVNLNYDDYSEIRLQPDVTALEEIVVIGYGMTKRSSVTASISTSTLDSEDFVLHELSGRVAGVQIISNSNQGEGVTIKVRGASTMNFDNTPLYVIDGVIYTGDISSLDQGLFKNMEILKGENATAIYGAKASNGVVLISTIGNSFKSTGKKLMPGLDESDLLMSSKANSIRNNFSDYGYWQPQLKTNSKGIASFNVTFPDDVTSWKTYVYAMNDNRQSGKAEGTIKSFKPLMAQLAVPRFLVEGDEVNALGKVLNYTPDTLNLTTTLEINDSTIFTKNIQCINSVIDTVSIAAHSTDTLRIKYFLKKEDGYFDGEQREVPVVSLGLEVAKGIFYSLDKDTTINLSFDPDLGDVTLYAQADILDVLESEIEHVNIYKYDCNEQLASKLKTLLAQHLISAHKGERPRHDKKIKKLISTLMKNQTDDNLWGWWKYSPTSHWISIHVIEALLQANEMGYKLKMNTNQIFDYLFWELESSSDKSEKIRILWAIRLINSEIDYHQYIRNIEKSDSISLNDLLHLQELKQVCNIPSDMDTIMHYADETMLGNLYFTDQSNNDFNLQSNNIQNTVLAYRILRRDSTISKDSLVKIRNYFLEKRANGYWTNTYQSAQIIETILPDILSGKKNAQASELTISGSLNAEVDEFPYEAKLSSDDQIEISKTGDFPVYLTAYQSSHDKNPKLHNDKFEVNSWFDNQDSTTVLESGKEVNLIVDVEVKKDAKYVMLNVPIPAGCSYVSKETNYPIESHREYFKEQISIFCESLRKGKYRFEISLLPRYTGKYHLNPAKAELMYFPTIYGNNEIKKVIVK